MTEIRSYRRVFDLERRIYSVDRIRLNPGGVPVRGVVYLLSLVLLAAVASRLPAIGAVLALVPWYMRELVLPAAVATVLAVVRVDGRTAHLAAASLLRSLARPSRTNGLTRASRAERPWRPPDLVFLADGSDARLRRLRYRGPGAVRVGVPHRYRPRPRRLRAGRSVLELRGAQVLAGPRSTRIIWLDEHAVLDVVPGSER